MNIHIYLSLQKFTCDFFSVVKLLLLLGLNDEPLFPKGLGPKLSVL